MNDVLYKGYYHNRESMHGNSPPHKQKISGDDSLNLSCFPFILQKQPTTIDFDEIPIIVTFAVCHSAASRRLEHGKESSQAKGSWTKILRSGCCRCCSMFIPSYQLSRQLLHLQCRKVLLRIFICEFSDILTIKT